VDCEDRGTPKQKSDNGDSDDLFRLVGSALVKPMLDGDFSAAIALTKDFRAAIPSA
jgi:hypothetical protein